MATMTAKRPLDWIREVEGILVDLEEKPQFGTPLDFNWSEFEKKLKNLLERPNLKVAHETKGWTTSDKVWSGLGDNLFSLTIDSPALGSPLYFVTSGQDLKKLMGDLIGTNQSTYFYDPSLLHGFYHYFVCEVLNLLSDFPLVAPLAPRLSEGAVAIIEPCFLLDLSLALKEGGLFWGRLLIPESFRTNWKRYFSNRPPAPLSEEAQEKILVDVSLEVGQAQLSFQEWKEIQLGDFLLLDRCLYDPNEKKGGVVLTVKERPIFRGRFKEEGIKLTEYPTYEEENASMAQEPEEEEIADLYEDEMPEKERGPSIALEELPIQLTIEVGRLKMTGKELLNLAPGNLLKLDTTPESGVDLVINGKKVGRGELIRLGETLGVRIISL